MMNIRIRTATRNIYNTVEGEMEVDHLDLIKPTNEKRASVGERDAHAIEVKKPLKQTNTIVEGLKGKKKKHALSDDEEHKTPRK
jgi:hypothetical protein